MAKTNNVASFKIKSPVNFVNFLKRFQPIDKGLLLELTPTALLAKSHTPDRATIKYSSLPLADVLEGNVPADLVKIAIYDVGKLVNVFKHFGESDEIFLNLKHEQLGEDHVGIDMTIKTETLKIKVECADLSLFTYIKPEVMKKIIDGVRSEMVLEFPFQKDSFARVNSLCDIDTGNDFITVFVEDSKVKFKSKSFEIELGDVPSAKNADLTFYNRQFGFIDPEVSVFMMGLNKMIVKSQESTTIMVIAKVEE